MLQNAPYNSSTVLETTHRIYSKDARAMPFLEDESVDLIVTSPPYPMIEMWDPVFRDISPAAAKALDEEHGWAAFEAMHGALEPVWREVTRLLRPGGVLCLNMGDATRSVGGRFSLYPNHARALQTLLELGLETLPGVIWRKPTNSPTKFMGSGMLPGSAYVTLEHEYILVLRKGGARKFARDEEPRRRESALFWEERNQWYSDLWDLRGIRQALPDGTSRKRSGAFPLEIPFRLIHMYSIQGDTVLDPFGGTGTTALAAAGGGRCSITVERDVELSGRVRALLRDGLSAARERVTRRLLEHRDFEDRYLREKGEPLPYRNDSLRVGVRTRQEKTLLPRIPGEPREEESLIKIRHHGAREEPAQLH